jgi:two-component system C4-dicarboxylate transport sensor histidine kinase DctB
MVTIIQKIIKESEHLVHFFSKKETFKNINETERYAQIGKVSSGLIHDLISPITTLQLQLSDEKLLNNPEYLKSLKNAVIDIGNYAKLIKNYLGGNLQKQETDLSDEIQSSIKILSHNAIKNNIQIHFIRKTGIKIFTHTVYIYQIAISLLSNAIEAYRPTDENRKIIVKLDKNKKIGILSVEDFGVGIKNVKEIFNPFFTTKKKYGGTGIGLSTVKYITEKELKGKIKVYSKPNKGSIFKIIFPILD